ncbi:hypothetical protein ACP70R_010404 [Stipagrostis hirtigluma subsp. patula]
MVSFAVQLKDMLLGLVERVTGYGRAAAVDKDTQVEPAKPPQVQAPASAPEFPAVIRSRDDPYGDGGSHDVVN